MPIERKKVDVSEERRILMQMCVSTAFLSKLEGIAVPKLFRSAYSRTVAEWIWEYYEHAKEAPGKAIQDVYREKSGTIEDESEIVAEFLQSLSDDYEAAKPNNASYSAKNALQYFKYRSLEILAESIQAAVREKDAAAGERLVSDYRRIEKAVGQGVSILTDTVAVARAFSQENEFLFNFPGALKELVGPLMRSDFMAIMGPAKRGKTWWLMFTAYRAAMMGLKTIFVSLEMNEEPMIRRFWKCFSGRPERGGDLVIPCFEDTGDGLYRVEKKSVRKEVMNIQNIAEDQKRFQKAVRGGDLRLLTYPSYSASVADLETMLRNLEYFENFVADVIVIDYADILKPMDVRLDYRHQLDQTWKALRGLAQKREALVVTGSQAGKSTLKRDVEAGDVSEDYRKLAHVTKMISLNQTAEEKAIGVMRLVSSLQREGKSLDDQVVVLQCLEIGRPYIDGKLKKEVILPTAAEKEKPEK
jgi:hypothetical protein